MLEIETALGGDNSPTDLLSVTRNTSGTTNVKVINVGGAGAQTVSGIKIVDVGGDSNGTFILVGDYMFEGDPAVIAGAYAYRLYKNGVDTPQDGDWYLRSALDTIDPIDPPTPIYQPGVPIYETYGQALLGFNALPTLQQRVGNRYWRDSAQAVFCQDPAQNYQCALTDNQESYYADSASVSQNGIWGRIEASNGRYKPDVSTARADYEQSLWRLQAGLDGQLAATDEGRLIGGVNFQYGTVSTDVSSLFGSGKIDTTGYGIGTSLTWYGTNGFYADGQVSVVWYDSDLNSEQVGKLTDGNDGFGYAFSIEMGKRFDLIDGWRLIPQAQLAYSHVDFDNFTDPFGAVVSLDKAESLSGRLGLAAEHQNTWKSDDGDIRRTSLYGIGNLYYEFLDWPAP